MRASRSSSGSDSPRARSDRLPQFESSGTLFLDKERGPSASDGQDRQPKESRKTSSSRRSWVIFCWVLTWWMPSFLLVWPGGMKRGDVRQAWREKFALNIIVWALSAGTIVSVVFLQKTAYVLVPAIVTAFVIAIKLLPVIGRVCSRSPSSKDAHDKFIICQVPCYTEGEESLTASINSLAKLHYDDKRKLIVIICDGIIIGSGNDRPTPRIVLDVLGADPKFDPEPLSYQALGNGTKQHNYAKVYSGLYECEGHVVPYLVIVKVGKPSERYRPGNRGKRDSQLLLMRFLNRVHFMAPMSPLELEIYHQLCNVIGVNPTFYEFLFTIDADTTVEPSSLNTLVSAMIHDTRLIGACGETKIGNADASWTTMIQVHEYHRSFHLNKAFESLFGSVTCLPGCFALFRLRTADKHRPLLISNAILDDYSENEVDTLHMKNLLQLGEDRYLTTLLLKHFPMFKTQFVRNAFATTVAPETWRVLVSQRRRWTNSTIHNLVELISVGNLCGFLCCSLRFVVFIDLLATVTQPVTVAYVVYLIHLAATQHSWKAKISLIMIGAAYGLQLIFFILGRMLDTIGWMIVWMASRPAYSFFMPLYAFWRMDDFTWGQTRRSQSFRYDKAGAKNYDDGEFDPSVIPLRTWEEYDNELWEVPTQSRPSVDKVDAELHPDSFRAGETSGNDSHNAHEAVRTSGAPGPTPHGPTDPELEQALREILQASDLLSVTKKDIRRLLDNHFHMDLSARKGTINDYIDRILSDYI